MVISVDPFATASAMLRCLRSRTLSAVELLDLHLRRIEQFNPILNAIITPNIEQARRTAVAADEARARGEEGALLGLPITVKDAIDVGGLRCTAGALKHASRIAETDAPIVARLRAAGAVIMGKTNTSPWTCGWHADNYVFGRTNNPWDLDRTPGGSTGGGAAALASGLTPLEFGSDAGGSIRVPAAWCGVYGHKPSYTAVPRSGHFPGSPYPNPATAIFVQGPLARSAEDLELALDVIKGPEVGEEIAWRLELPSARHERLDAFRVAVLQPLERAPLDDEIAAALTALSDALQRMGVRIKKVRAEEILGTLHDFYQLYWTLVWPIFGHLAYPAPEERQKLLDDKRAESAGSEFDYVRGLMGNGIDFLDAHAQREHYRAAFRLFFREWDVLLAPIVPVPALLHADAKGDPRPVVSGPGGTPKATELISYPVLANLPGQPATAFPVGFTREGLPIGLQVIGPYLEDRTPLRFAALLARETGGFRSPSAFAGAPFIPARDANAPK